MVDITTGHFKGLERALLAHSTLGFERVFKDVERILNNKTSSTFPPHNILMVNENNYIVELAIAGFSKEEVEITVEVKGAEFKDGILRVGLENVIPDHKKPRKVEISNSLNLLKPELLQESKAA